MVTCRRVHPNLHRGNDKVAHWTGKEWVVLPVWKKVDDVRIDPKIFKTPPPKVKKGIMKAHEDTLRPEDGQRWCLLCREFVQSMCNTNCVRMRRRDRVVERQAQRIDLTGQPQTNNLRERFKTEVDK